MKKIIGIMLFYLLATNVLFSQDTCFYQSFIIKIDKVENVPTVNSSETNNTVTLTHKDQFITDIFSKYIIYDFKKAFPGFTSEILKNSYKIMCSSKDLINELFEKVPNDVFNIENNFEGTTFNQDVIDFFDKKGVYNLKEYSATSDADLCVFDCDLNSVPDDFNISVKVYYDTTKELLVLESTEPTSCGNSFKFKFKKKVNSTDNKLVLWEVFSDAPCFNASSSVVCQVESTFYETVKSNFNLTFSLNKNSFIMKTPNPVFGENVMRFEQKTLSIKDNEFSESIIISPNPVKDFFNLTTNQQDVIISKISIFDYSGKELITTNNSFHKIDTALLSSGVYFLQVKTIKGFTIYKKIVKE